MPKTGTRLGRKAASRKTATSRNKARPAPIELEQQVGFLLRRAWQKNMAIWQSLCSESQLTSVQAAALVALYNTGPCSLTGLGRTTGMDPATTRGVAERLAERGLISFADDNADRRKVILHLHASGRGLVDRMVPVFREIADATMKPLNIAEQAALIFLLRKIAYADEDGSAPD